MFVGVDIAFEMLINAVQFVSPLTSPNSSTGLKIFVKLKEFEKIQKVKNSILSQI